MNPCSRKNSFQIYEYMLHGFLDYMMGGLLILLFLLADFADGTASTSLITLGVGTIFYSLITDYETSLLNIPSRKP